MLLSNYYKNTSSVDFIEDDGLITEDMLIDTGFFLEVYCNPEGKNSEFSDGFSTFLYIDKGIRTSVLLNYFEGYSINDDTLQINIISSNKDFDSDRRNLCVNVTSLIRF